MVMLARVLGEELHRIFPGDSELASRMRAIDWHGSKLGDPTGWSVTLRTALSLCLTSWFPVHLLWGTERTLLYNDAFAKLLGPKDHPSALAQSGASVLAEVWDQLSPMVDRAFRLGIASGIEDMRTFLDRAVPREEMFMTVSVSPVLGDIGVEGVFCTCTETTETMLAKRRLETLHRLAALAGGHTVVATCKAIGEVLAANADDIPFAILYVIEDGVPHATTSIRVTPNDTGLDASRLSRLRDAVELAVDVAHPYWPERITRALAVPVRANRSVDGVLVCGISPRRPLAASYRGFFELLGSHVGGALASAHAFEHDRQRVQDVAELARAKTQFFADSTHQLRAEVTQLEGAIAELLARPHDTATLESLRILERGALRLRALLQAEELDADAAVDKLATLGLSADPAGDSPADARAKHDFLSLFGHELRNPLSTLHVTLDVLARQSPGVEVTLMDRAVRQLTRLVDDLLDLSRLQRGKITLHRTAIELAQVVDLAVERVGHRFEDRKIQLFVRMPRTGLGVDCDPERIAQVVGNVLANAAKFSVQGGRVTVEATRIDTRVRLLVRDDGAGIASEELAHVFEPFRDRANGGGLGLGLAIARNLVELHGGQIEVTSGGHNKGTDVTIELPFAPTRDSQPVVAKTPRKRVLLVEDNHDTAVALQRALESLGYQVALAHNGPVALTVARAFQPDVALLDINLPVMDGWELSRRLRELEVKTHELQFVAVTARDQDEDKQRSVEAGFADHLVKPIDLSALERVVENLPKR